MSEPRQRDLPRGEHRITGHVTRNAFPLPDVTWEAAAPGAYDPEVDRQLAALQREVYGADPLCKPV